MPTEERAALDVFMAKLALLIRQNFPGVEVSVRSSITTRRCSDLFDKSSVQKYETLPCQSAIYPEAELPVDVVILCVSHIFSASQNGNDNTELEIYGEAMAYCNEVYFRADAFESFLDHSAVAIRLLSGKFIIQPKTVDEAIERTIRALFSKIWVEYYNRKI